MGPTTLRNRTAPVRGVRRAALWLLGALALGCSSAPQSEDEHGVEGAGGTGVGATDESSTGDAGVSSTTGAVMVCEPGTFLECDCSTREIGKQSCLADGSGYSGQCTECTANLPDRVTIEVREAVVMPGPSRGEAWDGLDTPPPEAWDAVVSAASGAPVPGAGEVVNAVLEFGIQGVDLPDVFGEASLRIGSEALAIPLEKVDNDLHPSWTNISWTDVELTSDTTVEISLQDEDLVDNDNIGSVSLRYDVLVDAWLAGGGYWYEGTPALADSANTIVGVKFAVLTMH